jgi:serine/threonine-protein kinase
VRQLATGGLSALYLCQLDGGRLVVLKEASIPAHGSDELKAKAREMFDREAKLLMKVDHPGIVHVLDCFVELDRNYMILEYVNGMDFWQLVRQNGPQREADVLEWAVQIATTLKVLHDREQPIIHRDVTPDNIILRNDGKVVLVDFGAANEFIGTATGTFVGKHSFIAPEQLRGKATTQSDIYAFGCTLYFLLVGSEPEAFATSNVLSAQEAAQAANPDLRITPTSAELCQLVESCTQLEASDRYQNVSQLLPVLKRLASQLAV